MANDLMGLFNTTGYDPMKEQLKQQGLFQQQLAGATDPRSFIAAVGSNMGGQLGGAAMRMFGDKTEEEKQQEAIKKALAETTGTDPVERLRSVAERLRAMGMEGAALKVDEQADAFEERSLKRSEREEKIKAKKERPQIVADRVQVLMNKFNMSEVEAKTIADNDTSWNSYIKPAKEYASSDYAKMLKEGGLSPDSDEFKQKMREYADAKTQAAKGDPVALANIKLLTKQVELQQQQIKLADAQQKQEHAEGQKRLREYMMQASTGQMVTDINAADKLIGSMTAGWGAVMQFVPGSAGMELRDKLTTIKANIGFDKLQQMRAASPTGGALGQVAVQELVALQSSLGSLNQWSSPDALKANLQKIKMHYKNFLDAQRKSMEAKEPLNGSIVTDPYDPSVNPTQDGGASPAAPAPAGGGASGGWSIKKVG